MNFDVGFHLNCMRLTGIAHFLQVPAMLLAPKMLWWKEDMAKLLPVNQTLFTVITKFILLTVLGLGAIVAWAAEEMVSFSRLAVGLSFFLGIFWLVRFFVQIFLYSNIWPEGFWGRISHKGLIGLFFFLAISYGANFVFLLMLLHAP